MVAGCGSGPPLQPLNDAEQRALRVALDDEYKAWATYDQVIADFGEVRPFINIREAEARHVRALHRLFEQDGLPVPPNPHPGRVPRYASVQAACAAGVAAEIDNDALYERLLAGPLRPEIATVLGRLQAASRERHLPAFRRCAAGGAGACGGRGRRRAGQRG